LLHYFVKNSQRLYGSTFVVYNVHNLLHLGDDVKHFGTCLDDLSAFPFENYLRTLKRLVRSTKNPIVQVAKRLVEYELIRGEPKAIQKDNITIKCNNRDSTVLLKNGCYADITTIRPDSLVCKIYSRLSLQPFYSEPCSSDLFSVHFMNNSTSYKTAVVKRSEIDAKAIKMPYKTGYVVMPLLSRSEK
jgi:hypothetical protein